MRHPKISFKNNWMKDLDPEVAGSSKVTQRIQPRPKTLLSRTGRPVKSCVPLCVERADKDKHADENVDADQTSTVRLVSGQPIGLFTQLEEIDIDFRVSGLPHAVVKEAENFRVRELVKKIECHPHRQALQADLQQNNVYNPFSNNSKAMIREMGNVELFELCETIPKVQCSQCLLWNKGVIYCTCGQFLVENESRSLFHKLRLDALSIPQYVIKKRSLPWCSTRQNWRTERVPYSLSTRGRDAAKELTLEVDIYRVSRSISQRPSIVNRNSKSDGQNKCKEMDDLAKENHTNHFLKRNSKDMKDKWYVTLKKSCKNGLMRLPTRFSSCCPSQKPSPPSPANRLQNPFLHNNTGGDGILPSSTSWWDKSEWNWWSTDLFLLQLVSFTVDGDPLWPTGGLDRYASHVIFSCSLHI